MKKLFMLLVVGLLVSGCAVLEIADIIFDDDCLYRGTVKDTYVVPLIGQTFVRFESGKAYTCESGISVDVGDWIEVRESTDGSCVFDW